MGEWRIFRPVLWCVLGAAIVLAVLIAGVGATLLGIIAVIAVISFWRGVYLLWPRAVQTEPLPSLEPIAPKSTVKSEIDPTDALYAAARSGEDTRALELLEAGADPHAMPPADASDQRSLLALAAVLPELDLLRALIARGVDVNHAHAGMTALIAATRDSWHGRLDAVTILIANGANPHLADADGNTPLHHAARSTNLDVAALLCDAKAGIETRNHEGVTPLGMACACGNWRLAKFLIEHGAHTDVANASPALLSAAGTDTDDPSGVELLLRHKARVNSCDVNGRSALHEAALHGNEGIIQALLAAGAEVDSTDTQGYSPLLDAVRGGHLGAFNTLLSGNPDVHRVDAHGRNALALACLSESPSVPLVQRLLELGVAVDLVDQDGNRAVDHAVSAGHWEIVRLLDPAWPLPLGVTDEDGDEQLPLEVLRVLLRSQTEHSEKCEVLAALLDADQLGQLLLDPEIAVNSGHLRWLLAKGAPPDVQDNDGQPLLVRLLDRLPDTLAAMQILLQHEGVTASGDILVRMLETCLRERHIDSTLEQCALDLVARDPQNHAPPPGHAPPLTLAVRLGWDRLLASLVSNGADLDARDPHGLAALHLCAALGREAALRILLRHGASVDLRTQDGQTPLGIALAAGRRELADWLDWRGWPFPARALCPADVPAAATVGDTRAVLRLLELGLPLEATDEQGCTALLRAAGGGHFDLVRYLVERGADLHHVANSGANPLSAAVSMNHTAVIACLLQAGANIEHRLPGGFTVLMLAAARGLPEVCQQLLDAGADLHATGSQGLGVLHCAALYGFGAKDSRPLQQLFTTLLAAGADSNAVTDDGLTPLLLLLGARAESGSAADESVIAAGLIPLLDAGARVDVQEDQRGFGPLHLAALHGLSQPARLLLRAGADLEMCDSLNRPPRVIAIAQGFIDIATELTQPLQRPDISMARFLSGGNDMGGS